MFFVGINDVCNFQQHIGPFNGVDLFPAAPGLVGSRHCCVHVFLGGFGAGCQAFAIGGAERFKRAAANGLLYADSDLDSDAQLWIAASAGEQVPVTDTMRDAVRQTKSVWDLFGIGDAALPVLDAAQDIQTDAVVSPLYGAFSADQYYNSLNTAGSAASGQTAALGNVAYLELRVASGFVPNAQQSWMVGEQPATAPAAGDSAVPSVTPAP